jgi:drug/metabolite transporter (DMT)-like permease
MISLVSLAFFLPSLILGAIGSLFLKKGAKKAKLDFTILKNYRLISGIMLSGISALLYTFSLKYSPLSVMFPLVSFNYILIAVLSAVFLKEKITLSRAVGIIFITLGCFLIIK